MSSDLRKQKRSAAKKFVAGLMDKNQGLLITSDGKKAEIEAFGDIREMLPVLARVFLDKPEILDLFLRSMILAGDIDPIALKAARIRVLPEMPKDGRPTVLNSNDGKAKEGGKGPLRVI